MTVSIRRVLALSALALFLALVLTFNPFSSRGAAALSSANWSAQTVDWSNVRTGPSTGFRIVTVYAPGTPVTVYASVSGQVIWGGISTWDRISSSTSSPLYFFGALLTQSSSSGSGSGNPQPTAQGKEIVVSISREWLWAFQNGKEVFNAAVMTARPGLSTRLGTYHVFLKLHPTTF